MFMIDRICCTTIIHTTLTCVCLNKITLKLSLLNSINKSTYFYRLKMFMFLNNSNKKTN